MLTTYPSAEFPETAILEGCRLPWQVELVLKRFESLVQLGHQPKYTDASAKAWLYGKLLVALLVEEVVHHTLSISPWRFDGEAGPDSARGVIASSLSAKSREPSHRDCPGNG